MQWVNDFRPQIDVDWSSPGDELEPFFQTVLEERKPREDGVNNAEHHNQLKTMKK